MGRVYSTPDAVDAGAMLEINPRLEQDGHVHRDES